jgi:hypothetical protein
MVKLFECFGFNMQLKSCSIAYRLDEKIMKTWLDFFRSGANCRALQCMSQEACNRRQSWRTRRMRLSILLISLTLTLMPLLVWGKDPAPASTTNHGKRARGTAITELSPALAVRAAACITCHAKIRSGFITDFGYGNSYFWGSPGGKAPMGPFNGSIYGDFFGVEPNKTAWMTAEISGPIIVPRADFRFDLRSSAGAPLAGQPSYQQALQASSLAAYLKAVESQKTKPSPIVEKKRVFIGAPTAKTLETRFHIAPGTETLIKFIKNNAKTSPDVKGIAVSSNGKYYTNVAEIVCDGDLFIRGTLFLNHATIATQNGCRIYATGPIFLQNAVAYKQMGGSLDRTNLQLVSTQAILMGTGEKNCSPSDKENPLARRLIAGIASDTFFTREAQENLMQPKAFGQIIYNQSKSMDSLEDASCHDATIPFSRLLLNAPQVHSRYKGKFSGIVIAEVILFPPGKSDFVFDPVFQEVPILPVLEDSDYLLVE